MVTTEQFSAGEEGMTVVVVEVVAVEVELAIDHARK